MPGNSKKSKKDDSAEKDEQKAIAASLYKPIKEVLGRILRHEKVTTPEWSGVVNQIFKEKASYMKSENAVLLKNVMIDDFKSFLSSLAAEESKLSPEGKVEHFGLCWERWSKSIDMVVHLLSYVQRYNADTFDLKSEMRSLWKTHMFSTECKENLVGVVCDIVNDHRRGRPANLKLVLALINSLEKMGEPKKVQNKGIPNVQANRAAQNAAADVQDLSKELQEDVVKRTRTFYIEESSRIESMTPSDAIKYVKEICDKEKKLVTDYLTAIKVERINTVLDEVLVVGHLPYFFKGFEGIVLSGNVELGTAIMDLYKRVNKLEDLLAGYFNIIKTTVSHVYEENLKEASNPLKFVELASTEYRRFHGYSVAAFPSDPEFSTSCDRAFIEVINNNAVVSQSQVSKDLTEISKNNAAAKILGQYVNYLLTPRKDRMGEKEFGDAQYISSVLYQFLKDKSTFQVMYRNNLARRLLSDETLGYDVEAGFLKLLKECGNVDEFIKASEMLNDVQLRDGFARDFTQYLVRRGSKFNINPLVCSVNWPMSVRAQRFQISKDMEFIAQCFKEFYTKGASKKSVSLLHQYGKGEIGFFTGTQEYFLSGSEYQLVLLPMIKKDGSVTLQRLADESFLTVEEVKYQLAFLIRYRFVLIKNPEGSPKASNEDRETWLPTTVVVPNQKFSHKQKRIVLKFSKADKEAGRKAQAGAGGDSSSAATVSEEEARQIFEDMVMRTEAVMVCVMKTRKSFSNRLLFSASVEMLQKYFPLNEKIFKRALEKLINDEILRRKGKGEVEYSG